MTRSLAHFMSSGKMVCTLEGLNMKSTANPFTPQPRKRAAKNPVRARQAQKPSEGLENYSPDVQHFLRLARKLKGAFTA